MKKIRYLFQNDFIQKIIFCVGCTILASSFFYYVSERYILSQTENNIETLLLSHKGIHHYVQEVMLPSLYEYKKENKLPREFYAPELFSSSYIVRNQHEFYNKELSNANYPQIYYKLASNNPRNPINKADTYESELIHLFNNDRSLQKTSKIINENGQDYLFVAIPFLENTKNCMACHGSANNAPKQLLDKYKNQGGFNEKIGEIRAITSIKAPLKREHTQLYIISFSLAVGTASFAFLMVFNSLLKRQIKSQTISLHTEINEKGLIASKLKANETYLQSMQNSMQAGLVLIDRHTNKIQDINTFALSLIGLQRNDVIGKVSLPITHSANDPNIVLEKSERILVDKDGKEIPILNTTTQVTINEKEYILESFINISKRKEIETAKTQLEKRLQHAQKMEAIGTLAGGIAHDFNNILGAIIGYAELAKESSPKDSIVAKDIERVIQAGERASSLVKQILAFSRQTEQEKCSIVPTYIVKEAINFLRPVLPSTISIKHQIDTTDSIIADPGQFHQIVVNLCTNAFHAMEQNGGTLSISLHNKELFQEDVQLHAEVQPGKFVMLSVKDSGIGMLPEVKTRIFEPYFTTKGVGKGTGMGLAIIHNIVTDLGGFITCDSSPGEGTLFQVFFPAIDQAALPVTDSHQEIPNGNERILYVDDEEVLAEMGKNMLERLGYHVTQCTSSTEALTIFQNQKDQFDVIITDYTMPGLTGVDLARRILQIRPDTPIILCTGYSSLLAPEKIEDFGIQGFVMKPIALKDIAILIRKLLDAK
ncbi:MAG: DUF3365 domain-containing protein [Desulfobulbus sp.]|nr:DUF3365 domain-containing protein [Desulfobulbus sp.]